MKLLPPPPPKKKNPPYFVIKYIYIYFLSYFPNPNMKIPETDNLSVKSGNQGSMQQICYATVALKRMNVTIESLCLHHCIDHWWLITTRNTVNHPFFWLSLYFIWPYLRVLRKDVIHQPFIARSQGPTASTNPWNNGRKWIRAGVIYKKALTQ